MKRKYNKFFDGDGTHYKGYKILGVGGIIIKDNLRIDNYEFIKNHDDTITS